MNTTKTKILVLGGTSEGIQITKAIASAKNLSDTTEIFYSLAGRTNNVPDIPAKVRIGGFSSTNINGVDGLVEYLTEQKIDLLIDATHPFAEQISANATSAANKVGIAVLRLERKAWKMPENSDVLYVPDMAEAASVVARTARRVLLTIGSKDLDAFTAIDKVHFVVRMIEPPKTTSPLDDFEIITGRPPFDLIDEENLMRHHDIDVLVSKASGGAATFSKIQAASNVGARIILIRRPPPPEGEAVEEIAAALEWIKENI
ncbi:MAG: cobalt-precorrin-6A reductase [Rhodospirillaceae bacterium]|nr:cobalt-precorrin-6A reductase [Rhodospirillaceae bacterium]